MGVSYYAKTIFGFPVTHEDFFKVQGSKLTCGRGHAHVIGQNYCPIDGTLFSSETIQEATPAFAAYAKKRKMDPEDLFEDMKQTYGRSSEVIGIHMVDARQSNMIREPGIEVLGFLLGEVDGEYEKSRLVSVSFVRSARTINGSAARSSFCSSPIRDRPR